ncbi:hypothetical protein GNI_148380 [Gregarina niphandrodes]|uniref:PHD-type domain-containing protein n=1 Tax=Gregarina niphandrodes TaxID=110365 RepID=A0A023B057_GRENI|nr:hypothetical protein GNI_148380 [Gregarina niphandrodes]EZG44354.1 hypothetical protein GNI_148380 [Gregarina niphandrodes]|eukprot:XP_011132701.1 hypothetical protein GNI_148380 [Gregarina niphandrodes]
MIDAFTGCLNHGLTTRESCIVFNTLFQPLVELTSSVSHINDLLSKVTAINSTAALDTIFYHINLILDRNVLPQVVITYLHTCSIINNNNNAAGSTTAIEDTSLVDNALGDNASLKNHALGNHAPVSQREGPQDLPVVLVGLSSADDTTECDDNDHGRSRPNRLDPRGHTPDRNPARERQGLRVAPQCVPQYYSKLVDWPMGIGADDWYQIASAHTFDRWLEKATEFVCLLVSYIVHLSISYESQKKLLTRICQNFESFSLQNPFGAIIIAKFGSAFIQGSGDSSSTLSRLSIEMLPVAYQCINEILVVIAPPSVENRFKNLSKDSGSSKAPDHRTGSDRVDHGTGNATGSTANAFNPTGSRAAACELCGDPGAQIACSAHDCTAVAHLACAGGATGSTNDWLCYLCEEQQVAVEIARPLVDRWRSCFLSSVKLGSLARRRPDDNDSQEILALQDIKPPPLWSQFLILYYRCLQMRNVQQQTLLRCLVAQILKEARESKNAGSRPPESSGARSEGDGSRSEESGDQRRAGGSLPDGSHSGGSHTGRSQSRVSRISGRSGSRPRSDRRPSPEEGVTEGRLRIKPELKVEVVPPRSQVAPRVSYETALKELFYLTLAYLSTDRGAMLARSHRVSKASDAACSRLVVRFLDSAFICYELKELSKAIILCICEGTETRRKSWLSALASIPVDIATLIPQLRTLYARMLNAPSKSIDVKKSILIRLYDVIQKAATTGRGTTVEAMTGGGTTSGVTASVGTVAAWQGEGGSNVMMTTTLLGRYVTERGKSLGRVSQEDLHAFSLWLVHLLTCTKQVEMDCRRWVSYRAEVCRLLCYVCSLITIPDIVGQLNRLMLQLMNLDLVTSASSKLLLEFWQQHLLQPSRLDRNWWVLITFCLYADHHNICVLDVNGSPLTILSRLTQGQDDRLPALVRDLLSCMYNADNDDNLQTGILKTVCLICSPRTYANVRSSVPWILNLLSQTPTTQVKAAKVTAALQLLLSIPKNNWIMAINEFKQFQLALLNLARIRGPTGQSAINLLMEVTEDAAPAVAALLNADLDKIAKQTVEIQRLPHACAKIQAVITKLSIEQLDACSTTQAVLGVQSGADLVEKIFESLVGLFQLLATTSSDLGDPAQNEIDRHSANRSIDKHVSIDSEHSLTPRKTSPQKEWGRAALLETLGKIVGRYSDLANDQRWVDTVWECLAEKSSAYLVTQCVQVLTRLLQNGSRGRLLSSVAKNSRSLGGKKLLLSALPIITDIVCERRRNNASGTDKDRLSEACMEYLREVYEQGLVPTSNLLEAVFACIVNDSILVRNRTCLMAKSLITQGTDTLGSLKRKMWSFVLTTMTILFRRLMVDGSVVRIDQIPFDDNLHTLHELYLETIAEKATLRAAFLGPMIQSVAKITSSINELLATLNKYFPVVRTPVFIEDEWSLCVTDTEDTEQPHAGDQLRAVEHHQTGEHHQTEEKPHTEEQPQTEEHVSLRDRGASLPEEETIRLDGGRVSMSIELPRLHTPTNQADAVAKSLVVRSGVYLAYLAQFLLHWRFSSGQQPDASYVQQELDNVIQSLSLNSEDSSTMVVIRVLAIVVLSLANQRLKRGHEDPAGGFKLRPAVELIFGPEIRLDHIANDVEKHRSLLTRKLSIWRHATFGDALAANDSESH